MEQAENGLVSIGAVAKAAGVSVATVSRVLNDLDGVGRETADRVRDVLRKMNYRPLRARKPNRGASSRGRLRGKRHSETGSIAAITLGQANDWLELPVMAAAVGGIREAARTFGYRLILDEILDPSKPGVSLEKSEVDGAILFVSSIFPPALVADALHSLNQRLPIVWAMGSDLDVNIDHVASDHLRIGHLAYRFLAQRGCKQCAFVGTHPDWGLMRLRCQSFLNAAYDAKLPAQAFIVSDDAMVIDSYGKRVVTASTSEALVQKIARSRPRPDGLYISNDLSTVELYPLLKAHGLQPAKNVTIVSCDNEQIRLAALQPRPASIDIGAAQVGRRAVLRLMARLDRPHDPPVSIHVSPRLVMP
jgi:DNA-binding LacI/PurR family transcriptional regulator